LSKRYYVRTAILKYLDIPRDGAVPKPRCGNPLCVNPYHFEYHGEKNAKLSSGDIQMLLAFHGQGASARQIAKALNVNRSTIYRKLKDERLHSGIARRQTKEQSTYSPRHSPPMTSELQPKSNFSKKPTITLENFSPILKRGKLSWR
jgi:predicted transcriptional regulator